MNVEVGRMTAQVESPPEEQPETWVPDPHYAGWSDDEVAGEFERVSREHARRQTMAEAAAATERAAETYRAAAGISDGTAWQQPTGAHDAVPAGETRVFEDGTLRRNVSGAPTSHHPDVFPEGWEIVADDVEPVEPDPGDYPEWAPDTDYEVGDVLTYDGTVYEVVQAHRSQAHWLPPTVASLYRQAAP